MPFSNLPQGSQEILTIPARSCWANTPEILQCLHQKKRNVFNHSVTLKIVMSIEHFIVQSPCMDITCDQGFVQVLTRRIDASTLTRVPATPWEPVSWP